MDTEVRFNGDNLTLNSLILNKNQITLDSISQKMFYKKKTPLK